MTSHDTPQALPQDADTDAYDQASLAARGVDESLTFARIAERHLERRSLLKGLALAGAAASVPATLTGFSGEAKAAPAALTFESLGVTKADTVTVPPGYKSQVVIQWGDPLFAGMAPFDLNAQTPAEQARRFGFNNDMVALFPLPYGAQPKLGGRFSHPSYLMAVNHEYATGVGQFPDYPIPVSRDATLAPRTLPTRNHVETQMESVGVSVVEINMVNGNWVPNVNSAYNRRVTATTPMDITGPARGDTLMQTPADPTGVLAKGTFANCAGGLTPWGTYLTCEENWDGYFNNRSAVTDATLKTLHASWSSMNNAATPATSTDFTLFWEAYDSRFDLSKAEGVKEPFRFGWVVEIDPYTPGARPKKRTALGRFKHEAAQSVLNASNRLVVYTGDDERFQYAYKYVSNGRYNAANRAANDTLLDEGVLYVAKFSDNGTGTWLPLDFATLNLLSPGKFRNQADVLIRAREAAAVLGATPMDRPEDIEAPRDANWRGNGKVYMVMTNNSNRTATGTTAPNAANPRASNISGHILEITEADNDMAATRFTWTIFLLAGNPSAAAGTNTSVVWNGVPTFQGPAFGAPDNIAFDSTGNLFIATDGTAPTTPTCNDQVLVTSTAGGFPRQVKRFLVGPAECEICGPLLSPDDTTFFCAVQHPGEDGAVVDRSATNSKLRRTSVWPTGSVPRPAVVAVRRTDGGRIGS